MKYAVINSKFKVINRLVDEIPPLPPGMELPPGLEDYVETHVEITDEQAEVVAAGLASKPVVLHVIDDGELLPLTTWVERSRPRRQTKLTIMRRLQALDKWATFKAVMAQLPEEVQDAWNLAQDISNQDPLFAANKEMLKAALSITEEELRGLFA